MHKAPQLPKKLLDRISGSSDDRTYRNHQHSSIGRKRRRKAERTTKRLHKSQSSGQAQKYGVKELTDESESGSSTKDAAVSASQKQLQMYGKPSHKNRRIQVRPSDMSGNKASKIDIPSNASRFSTNLLSNEDETILALERKLGRNGKKTSRLAEDDGLEDLLTGAGKSSESDGSFQSDAPEEISLLKRKRVSVRETAKSKRARFSDESDGDGHLDSDKHIIGYVNSIDGSVVESEPDSFDGLSFGEPKGDGESGREIRPKNNYEILRNRKSNRSSRTRENPYMAPLTSANYEKDDAIKHKPSIPSQVSESDAKLKRQLQGLLNRLTESNLATVFAEVERKYQDNPRHSVTSTLTELILDSIADDVALNETFLVLQAAFVTAMYRVIGIDFGAYLVESAVARIDKHYEDATHAGRGKKCLNLITFLADLFLFNCIASNLLFDYIQIFLKSISETHTELLLRVVKTCGPQLRQDDPLALKDIVTLLQGQISQMKESEVSVRTKFMVESITALKNNRMRTNAAGSSIITEQVARMRKILGSLNAGMIRAREPLRVKLEDVRNAPQRGKWWLVGASWKEAQRGERKSENGNNVRGADETPDAPNRKDDIGRYEDGKGDDANLDLVQLAREQLMITDVRRSIFVAIMSASDYRDAHIRLMKLKLKRVQEAEVPKVLLHCAAAEISYNPYYSLVARRLCGEYRLRMAFQYSLWHFLGRLQKRRRDENDESGDTEDEDDDDDFSNARQQKSMKKQLQYTKIVNYAHLYGSLIAQASLPVSILKVIEFDHLQSQTKLFIEILLINIILDTLKPLASPSSRNAKPKEDKLLHIFAEARDFPDLVQGLRHFVRRVLLSSDIVREHAKHKVIKRACAKIEDILMLGVAA